MTPKPRRSPRPSAGQCPKCGAKLVMPTAPSGEPLRGRARSNARAICTRCTYGRAADASKK